MRIIKAYDERRNEILDTAERLFHMNGYEKCTVNDILKEVAIAKGTFYHYFKSKEEVLDAIVLRYKEIVVSRAEKILKKNGISPEEKLMHIFMAMRINDKVDSDMLNELHKTQNALLHQKTLNQIVTAMSPILVKVIEEGIERKAWSCRYPLQYMQIFLAASLTLTDEGIFVVDADSQMKVMAALISMLEKMLEVPSDSFMQLFMQYWG
ncbi:TetR/AcrR family transcriptional regulator [Geosporobacter ferrireducens]|uniref:TetR family transcriptional regulator n=1 Tax=Geosporobacter ferrireducens TaxID=1424294 RepID=A0A1D8GED0_9FIRM|nr:TetR/AcrR family transcriptional regulator [Geosporobacter ferrireducens]AOT69273.1 TetR family transcriptional regulator [Geosporobacter ferrireducens]MTI56956.1 TetR/AcrR family transcriptional regulator [Geosporobacter ferrireducens]